MYFLLYIGFVVYISFADDMFISTHQVRDVSEPQFLQLAWDAVPKVNAVAQRRMVPIRVLRASATFVGFDNYDLEVEYGAANCQDSTPEKCVAAEFGPREVYEMTIYSETTVPDIHICNKQISQ